MNKMFACAGRRQWPWFLLLLLFYACMARAQSASNPHEVPMHEMEMPQTQTAPAGISDTEAKALIVARVNGAPITLYTVREGYNRMKGIPQGDNPDAAIQSALDRAVFEEMVYQKGIAQALAPDAGDIDSKIQALKEKMGQEAFEKALAAQKQTEPEWRAAYVRKLIIDRVLMKELAGLTVSDEDLAKQYEMEKSSFLRKEKVEVTDIVFFLKLDDPASSEIAEKMLIKVRDGEDKDPHHLSPDGTFIVHDREVTAEKQPELYAEAKKLKAGEYSGVIHGADALHILRLKEYVSEKQFTLDEVKPILKSKLMNEARKKRIMEFEAELKKEDKIETTDIKEWKDKL